MVAQPGAWITGNIELLAPIAEGAMGKVWVAFHHRLRIRVAVKFVHDKLGSDTPEAIARFEHEASLASQIKSPHVVQTFDSGIAVDGTPYIVMELLEGHSLGQRLRTMGPLTWREATAVLAQVARALTKAHELGIVHRDIKPDNIFLSRSDDGVFCKVFDFGVAKQTRLPAMGGLTTDGKIVGTPEYMSPEQVLDDVAVDYRADLWALAVVLYQAVTGRLPFNGKTLGQLCLNLVHRRPTAPSKLRAGLPAGADAWFARALSRDPAQRFTSARDMAMAFAETGEGMPTDLLSPTLLGVTEDTERQFGSSSDQHTTRMRRLGTPLLVGTVAVGLLLLGGAGLVLSARGATDPPVSRLTSGLVAPAAAVAVAAARALEPAVSTKPLPLDADDGSEPVATDEPGRTSAVRPPLAATRASQSPATAAPSARAAPSSTESKPGRRGKEELGF
jgi:serine/threonine-protein kinase